jgi:EmrB/QacA subfamily drug resistance transporter
MAHSAAAHHASKFTNKQRSIALLIVALAFVMDLLDTTIVNIAIPSIQADLGASFATIQWLVAGYTLAFALLLITGGRMGDVFGYKKMFLIGITGFTLASLLCGVSTGPEMLIGARLLQGAMAALMVPQVMSLMQVMYKHDERGKVMGLFGMLGGLAATLGPIVGGVLIEANLFGWDWRPIFLINVPVGIIAIIAAIKFLPDGKSEHPLRLDIIGTGILVVALSLLVFPLIQGRELDWPAWTYWMLAAAVPVIGLFAWYERRKDKKDGSALVVPALAKVRTFVTGQALNLTLQLAMIGFFLTFTLTLQAGFGFDVLKAAFIGIPTAVGIGLSIAVLGQKLIPKLGRYVVSLGAVLTAIGMMINAWVISQGGMETNGFAFAPGLLITGLGLGTIMTTLFSVTLKDVDTAHAGSASGVMSAVQQIGGAIGVAVIGVIFFGQLGSGSYAAFDAARPQLQKDLSAMQVSEQTQQEIINGARECFHDRTQQKDSTQVPASCERPADAPSGDAGKKLEETIVAAVKNANADNFASAYQAATIFSLGVLAVVFALSFALPRHFKAADPVA